MNPTEKNVKFGQPGMAQDGQEEMDETGSTIPIASYPELKDAEEGQQVMIQGTVASNDGQNVTVNHDSVKLQVNQADKTMGRLTGKKGKPAPEPQGDDQGDEGY